MGSNVSTDMEADAMPRRRPSDRSRHYLFHDPSYGRLNNAGLTESESIDQLDRVLSFQPRSSLMNMTQEGEVDSLADIDFPYENLVFEGGGSQGTAYIGAIMELERLGHMDKICRFGGTSVGSITATILALGHGSEKFIDVMINGPFFNDTLDARCGACSMIPNVFRHLGWHPGRRFYQWLGEIVSEKLGNPDATFRDLFGSSGRELCVVVTNLSHRTEEYCHVKTTPDLPIRAAVRMSMAIPGVFFPFQWRHGDKTDLYVDGAVLCNYPVHCFDGWWLSMLPEDSFLRRLQPLADAGKLLAKKARFGSFNKKTLGFILFSDYDQHVLAMNPALIPPTAPIPDTHLASIHRKFIKTHEREMKRHRIKTKAMSQFIKVLNDNNLDGNDTIDIGEFKRACNLTNEFTLDHMKALFGDQVSSATEIFDMLDVNKDGQVDFQELMGLAERHGVGLQAHVIGAGRADIRSPSDFISGIFQSLMMSVRRAFVESDDNERTVMISTVYLQSMDFKAEQQDWAFLIEQGRRGMRAFLSKPKKPLVPYRGIDQDIEFTATVI